MPAVAFWGLVAATGAARADVSVLCPNQATESGNGASFTSGSSGPPCSSASTLSVSNTLTPNYAAIAWGSGVTGYPAGLTLGGLLGLDADVTYTGNYGPYYMLAFADSSDSLGQNQASDQILMIESENSPLSGNSMVVDPATTLFNFFDYTSNTTSPNSCDLVSGQHGCYLLGGQFDTKTLDGWLALYPALSDEPIEEIQIGIANTGTADPSGESLTMYSLDVTTTPEPTSLVLLLILMATTALGVRYMQARNRRANSLTWAGTLARQTAETSRQA